MNLDAKGTKKPRGTVSGRVKGRYTPTTPSFQVGNLFPHILLLPTKGVCECRQDVL